MPKEEQGLFPDRYQVIPRTLIFVTRPGQVLLLKGSPHKKLWANRYNGIGGHIEKGEDVLTAAERELREEAGLVTSGLRLCGTLIVDADDRVGIAIFLMKAEYVQGKIKASPEGFPEWVALSEISKYPLVEDLPEILPKVLAMEPGESPFSARSYYDEGDKLRIVFRN